MLWKDSCWCAFVDCETDPLDATISTHHHYSQLSTTVSAPRTGWIHNGNDPNSRCTRTVEHGKDFRGSRGDPGGQVRSGQVRSGQIRSVVGDITMHKTTRTTNPRLIDKC